MGHIQAECRIRISDEKNGMQGGISKNKKKPPRKSKERKYPNLSDNQSQKQVSTAFSVSLSSKPSDMVHGQNNQPQASSAFIPSGLHNLSSIQNNPQPRGIFVLLTSNGARTGTKKTRNAWIDSGANYNFIWDKKLFTEYRIIPESSVITCDGQSKIVGEGKNKLPLNNGESIEVKARHAPRFNDHILALSSLVKFFDVRFEDGPDFSGVIFHKKGTNHVVLTAPEAQGLYAYPTPLVPPGPVASHSRQMIQNRSYREWNQMLGHVGFDRIMETANQCNGIEITTSIDKDDVECTTCLQASTRRAPVRPASAYSFDPLTLTHTDIAGPVHPPSLGNAKYVAVFIDDATKMSGVYFLHKKEKFFQAFTWYKKTVET